MRKCVWFSFSWSLKQNNTQIYMNIEWYEMFTCLAVETSKRIRENIHSPCMIAHEEFSWRLRVTFKLFWSLKTLDFMWVDFYTENWQKFTNSPLEIQ